jgi:hypothetical protein
VNDHTAHRGDIVRDKNQPAAIPLTVDHVEPGSSPNNPLLVCTKYTGGPFIRRLASTVDVLTPSGCTT